MVRNNWLFYIFLFSSALVLQQACGTNPTTQPPAPEEIQQATPSESSEPEKTPSVATLPEARQDAIENLPLVKQPIQRSLPESLLNSPDRDLASRRLEYDTVLVARAANPPSNSGWHYRTNRQGRIVGFEFSNHGGNRILPQRHDIAKNSFFTRDFQFRFDDRARQDIHLSITDWVPSRDRQFRLSELMTSVLHFFPRNYLPAIVTSLDHNIVTLPTGEEVEFDAKTHEVVAGVFTETPVDPNPDKSARRFPGIDYHGKGVLVRANSRGTDPRIGTAAIITTVAPAPDCAKGAACNRCHVPSRELWEQNGAVRFRFSTDQEFDRYLLSRCGFGLPRNGADFTVAAPVKLSGK
jgi:hypothetical protein